MDFIKQNKKDIFYIVLLFTILFAVVIFRLPYFGDSLTDSGREFMFAEAMTDGKLLGTEGIPEVGGVAAALLLMDQ